eukprot:10661482-Heterocapsa_arctica.AAC.1
MGDSGYKELVPVLCGFHGRLRLQGDGHLGPGRRLAVMAIIGCSSSGSTSSTRRRLSSGSTGRASRRRSATGERSVFPRALSTRRARTS